MTRRISTGRRIVVSTSLAFGLAALAGCASGGDADTGQQGGKGGSGGNGGTAGAAGSGGSFAGAGGSAGSGGSFAGSGGSFAGAGGSVGGSGGSFAGAGGSAGSGGSFAGAGGSAGSAGSAGSGGTTGTPEICNGLDDNGDGQIDEGNPGGGGPCTVPGEAGECAKGTLNCRLGQLRCEPNTGPTAEVCDGLDNDCDGQVDEGNPEGGQACSTGLAGVCAVGVTQCDTTTSTVVCLPTVQPGTLPEQCNQLDDDCDGEIDEGDPGGGNACTVTSELGVCRQGLSRCEAGQIACIQQVFPTSEVCDGLDNDCDGSTDNPPPGQQLPGVGLACTVGGAQGQCALGTQACAGGAFQCNPINTPIDERCDGLDNDCNGAVDNGNALALCTRNCQDWGRLGAGQQIPNAPVFTCNSGSCEFAQGSCPAGRVDANGDICDGCEAQVCTTTYVNTCASPTTLDGTINGTIMTLNGASHFRVTLNRPNPNVNQSWNPRIVLSSASVSRGYRMDILTNCSTTATCPIPGGTGPAVTATNVTEWVANYATSRLKSGTTILCGGSGNCTDNSNPGGSVIVRIRRAAIPGGGSNPECEQFSVTFSQ